MNIIKQVMRVMGCNKEQIVQDLVATGKINEQDARRMVMSGDNAGLLNFARQHQAQAAQDRKRVQQARYLGAPVPENF